jgi:putative aldouronate transport system permease protein
MIDRSLPRRVFNGFNILTFIVYSLLCLVPLIHILAISLSASATVSAGKVTLWPVNFTIKSYKYVIAKKEFWRGLSVSGIRVILGVAVNMFLTIVAAFPLSKSPREFKAKNFFIWYFIFTMLFSGGMIPTYMIVRYTKLLNTIWALIIPGAVPVFNVILLMNFFKAVPTELEESAFMDGANYFRILWSIYLPVSLPALATLTVFSMVGHWNSWFDGMIYMNDSRNYPLQTYLQSILISANVKLMTKAQAELLRLISDRTLKAAQVFIAAIPILLVYPFLQKYFVTGLTLGSIKE